MAIYTRSGDDGTTGMGDGRAVRKSDPSMRAMGAVDELAAMIGLSRAACANRTTKHIAGELARIQGDAMTVCGILAGAASGLDSCRSGTERLEGLIDAGEAELARLGTFILPGGCELACRLNVARTVCRRAEREAIAWADAGGTVPPQVRAYLNRLGDAMFVLARLANSYAGVDDVAWPEAGAPQPGDADD